MQVNEKVKKVLLVDNDLEFLEQNKLLLESKGVDVFKAETGEEGSTKFYE